MLLNCGVGEDSWESLDCRRSNQSILKEISPEYSLKGLMLKLKVQYFGHLMRRTDSVENILMLGKTEGRRRRGWQRMRWLHGITNAMDMSLCCSPWGCKESDTTELNWTHLSLLLTAWSERKSDHQKITTKKCQWSIGIALNLKDSIFSCGNMLITLLH